MAECHALLVVKDHPFPIYCRRSFGHRGAHMNGNTGHEWSEARPDHAHIAEVRERYLGLVVNGILAGRKIAIDKMDFDLINAEALDLTNRMIDTIYPHMAEETKDE